MILDRLTVVEEVMPPVGICIIFISIAALALVDDDPGSVGVLFLVVATKPELLHVVLVVVYLLVAVVSLHEKVGKIY